MALPNNAQSTLPAAQLAQFENEGYLILRGLLARDEAENWREHFMALHARGPVADYFSPKALDDCDGDLLRAYPRMLMPHVWDETARRFTLDARFYRVLRALLGEEPLAAQSMLYFKPPGARGQALHQDNFYLKVAPGTCLATWLSLDDADAQNGGLSVVPGSHRLPVLCPHAADLSQSFTIEEVAVPRGMQPVPIELNAGDALFFNGSVIHGSGPNLTRDRFRRSFICHYVGESTISLNRWNQLMNFDGERVHREAFEGGGPCGTDEIELLRRAVLEQNAMAQTGREQNAIGY